MGTFIVILLVFAAITFGYLVYRVGWQEAIAATVVLFGSIWAAVQVFVGSFGGGQ